ncbi:sigma-54-dependent Fis family transcriptional regulator [Zobellella endophytica]|uniref:Sigma-54-dependent Fis family transcriptional regulator n=1 Tax=Zobellella endophytica TaxID=2116700 RepID=A0A2P7R990_9GAMM|nr:sigma-54 dependent transcriptional regulator [Zobellella endophytica]PSJ46753.1 sigma-54-dependent Fis family transcriptional regulator [Zobellella endophytica]
MEHSILIVEDDPVLAENIQTYLRRRQFDAQICHSAEEALTVQQSQHPDIVLTDNSLPGMNGLQLLQQLTIADPQLKVIMMTGYGNIEDAVEAMKVGAFHYLTKPVALAELKLLLDKALQAQRMECQLHFYQHREGQNAGLAALLGNSAAMQKVKQMVRQLLEAEARMAGADLPSVLIEGETGTGKELVARALHVDGCRSKEPFVEFNCASIPSHLLEAELFGHEKGAFTDAKERRIGLVEAADGGTLFLDEIGEMDLGLQAKLLKLLEDRTIRRIGSVKERKINLRIVSATNCNLEEMVRQGKFRSDLFFRLKIISIKLPSLAERGDDILLLARHFLAELGRRYGKAGLQFSPAAERLLHCYRWPGNVRELRNMLEQAVLLAQSPSITPEQLGISLVPDTTPAGADEPEPAAPGDDVEADELNLLEFERDMVIRMLHKTDWNVTKSARLLGITRDMLRYRIERLGLVRPERRC